LIVAPLSAQFKTRATPEYPIASLQAPLRYAQSVRRRTSTAKTNQRTVLSAGFRVDPGFRLPIDLWRDIRYVSCIFLAGCAENALKINELKIGWAVGVCQAAQPGYEGFLAPLAPENARKVRHPVHSGRDSYFQSAATSTSSDDRVFLLAYRASGTLLPSLQRQDARQQTGLEGNAWAP
jgi:hypothetical protein